MTSRTRRIGLAILCCSLVVAPDIWAFFPIGAYDSAGVLRIRKYRINDFDRNNDGRISEDEGIEVLLEGGPSGFTEDELDVVREAFAVWERIPQSYASFYEDGVFEDPTIADGESDLRNTIVMFVPSTVDRDGDGQPDEDVVPDPPGTVVQPTGGPLLGYNVSTWAGEDVIIETDSESYLVSGNTIIDSDIVIDGPAHRPAMLGEEPEFDLLGVVVHELGHFLGLAHTPLNNLSPLGGDDGSVNLVEGIAMVHSIAGVKRQIGITPTMFPFYFDIQQENGDLFSGGADLGPDDISGMAWLYPRGSQDLFFHLHGEARTHTRPGTGIPSIEILGGHVVAWADVDNDPSTPRIAAFSALTGYYEHPEDTFRNGRFDLLGMWKQMETESGLFNATYTYTLTPLNGSGYDRQAPPGIPFDAVDRINFRSGEFNAYPSEVFHEVENIIDVSNKDAGTPFVWDFQRGELVSVDTERAIETIVGADPMFGDPNDVCILNVVGTASATGGGAGLKAVAEGANRVRSVRDSLLLETALGSFIVDAYYTISPSAAHFLLNNSAAYSATASAVRVAYWCLDHLVQVAVALAAMGGLFVLLLRRRRLARAGRAGALMLVLLAGLCVDAGAAIAYQTTEQLVAGATDVISGRVVSATSRRIGNSIHVYTDIVVEIDDKAKGTLNKQSTVTFTQIGGRVDGLVTEVSEFPTFEAGQEVVLYLSYVEDFGFVVYSGIAGKIDITINGTTGAKSVRLPSDFRAKLAREKDDDAEVPETMAVSEFMDALRAIAKAQEE